MSEDCARCATYLDVIAQLQSEINRLAAENQRLRDRLGMLRGDVDQAVRVIDSETENPSTTKTKLIETTRDRLAFALENAA